MPYRASFYSTDFKTKWGNCHVTKCAESFTSTSIIQVNLMHLRAIDNSQDKYYWHMLLFISSRINACFAGKKKRKNKSGLFSKLYGGPVLNSHPCSFWKTPPTCDFKSHMHIGETFFSMFDREILLMSLWQNEYVTFLSSLCALHETEIHMNHNNVILLLLILFWLKQLKM